MCPLQFLRFFVFKWYLRFKIKYIKIIMPLLVCRRAHVVFMLFVFLAYSGVQHVLTLYMSKSRFFWWVHVAHIFSFLCCPTMCLYVLRSVWSCPLRFPHKTMFVSSLPPVVCRRTHVIFTLFVFVYA